MPRRALFIAYLYPPVGGMSPRVALNYARALARAGCEVDVVTPAHSAGHPVYRVDDSLRGASEPGVTVHATYPGPLYRVSCSAAAGAAGAPGADSIDATRAARTRDTYRRFVRPWMIPDGRADWLPWAAAKGFELLRRRRYDLLLTYAFPYTCHLVGRMLHGARSMPWVLHQGDLWSFSPGIGLPRWRAALDRRLERGVLERAHRVIVNAEATVDGYVRHFPRIPRSRYAVIPTGYDAKLYAEPATETASRFRLVFTGAVPDTDRGHWTLLDALAGLKRRGIDDVECVFAGHMPQALLDHHASLGLNGLVDFRGFRPAAAIAGLQKSAHALVLFGMRGGLQVPSKLYEYYAAARPLLVVAYDDTDVAAADVSRRRRGVVVPDRAGRVAEAILKLRAAWKRGTLDDEFNLNGNPALSWDQAGERFLAVVNAAVEGRT